MAADGAKKIAYTEHKAAAGQGGGLVIAVDGLVSYGECTTLALTDDAAEIWKKLVPWVLGLCVDSIVRRFRTIVPGQTVKPG
jgi:hypothetical protein